MTPFFNAVNYDEADANFAEWTAMADRAQAVYDELPASTQPTFFEAVLRPVLAGKRVFEIYTKAALSSKCTNQHRASATQLARDVQTAFATDKSFKADGTVSSVESGSTSWVRRTSATSLRQLAATYDRHYSQSQRHNLHLRHTERNSGRGGQGQH
jgi:hypothetical protein